jgi:hypothetical protein
MPTRLVVVINHRYGGIRFIKQRVHESHADGSSAHNQVINFKLCHADGLPQTS